MVIDAVHILEGVGKTLGTLLVVRPHLDGDRILNAEVVWASTAGELRSGLRIGDRVADVYGPDIADLPPTLAAEAALRSPGTTVTFGPYESGAMGEPMLYEITAVTHDEYVVLKFHDRTQNVLDQRDAAAAREQFRVMLDGLEPGVVLLQPHFDANGSGQIVDAEVMWANNASRSLWTNQDGLLPGTRVVATYYDRDEWLDAANRAWKGESVSRILRESPGAATWTAATEVLRRVGENLMEFTHDRSNDQQLLDRLVEADHRFAALVEDLPLTVFVGTYGHDELSFVSPNAAKTLGLPPHRLQRISDLLQLVHPDDRPTALAMEGWSLGENDHYAADWRITRPDGTQMIGAFSAVRRPNPNGDVGFIALVSDVTEQRQLLEQLETGERLQAMGRAAGSIAHDFNNLLMIVSGNIDRARKMAPQAIAPLTTAANAAGRAADLAQSMLAFARGKPGAPRLVAVRDLIQRFQPIIEGTLPDDATCRQEFDEHLPPVFADSTHLEQILLNLVTNSRDALGPRGTVTISATLADTARCHLRDEAGQVGPFVAITVSDDGEGISSLIKSRVWEPYFSSKAQTREHGTGLGLSTVHGIVHQYGGHVHLESEAGAGTRVTCYLPAVVHG